MDQTEIDHRISVLRERQRMENSIFPDVKNITLYLPPEPPSYLAKVKDSTPTEPPPARWCTKQDIIIPDGVRLGAMRELRFRAAWRHHVHQTCEPGTIIQPTIEDVEAWIVLDAEEQARPNLLAKLVTDGGTIEALRERSMASQPPIDRTTPHPGGDGWRRPGGSTR